MSTRYAILGALGGAFLGAASLALPALVKHGWGLPAGVTLFVIAGTAALGGLFGRLTHDAR